MPRYQLYYCDQFQLPLPAGHRFPMAKYARLRARIEAADWRDQVELLIPPAATDAELGRAHSMAYIDQMQQGELDREAIKRLGFPWSAALVERSRRSSGATLAAARAALNAGFAANLAGGTHHAFADHGEGFCLFNVTARALQAEGLIERVAIIDADVHQGNGTAAIAHGDPTIFTFSIHCEQNYPFVKQTSDWDIELPAGTGDVPYLEAFTAAVPQVLDRARPDLVIYVSGADPYHGDRLGRLAMTKGGLLARDQCVYRLCADRQLPVVVSMAGGYADEVEDIVDIHYETIAQGVLQPRLGVSTFDH
jgi:acetoin utilization deacetylase AcuC-like enzyme